MEKGKTTSNPPEEYYFYHNWISSNSPLNKIHKGSCGFCQFGKGSKGSKDKGKRSVWVGPFKTIEYVENYLERIGIDDHLNRRHKCLDDQ